jgi:protein phosphatase
LTSPGRVRPVNEDAFVVFEVGRYLERRLASSALPEIPERAEITGHVMIVADGVGGRSAGEVASGGALTAATEKILASPHWALKLDDPATRSAELDALDRRVREYLTYANQQLRDRAAREPKLEGMGTTLTGAYAVGRDLFILHVGDSRAYLERGGRLERVTRDHTLAQEFVDLGMMSEAEAEKHRLHHVLTRAVGTAEGELAGDFLHFEVGDGDRLVLCSDGLTNVVSEAHIAEVLKANPQSQAACVALVDQALDHGAPDNVTVIVAGFHAAPES